MGLVVAARHEQLDQRVAIKLMLPDVLGNAEAVARFLREARAAARLASDHVVRVFDVGTLENGAPYMAMEYLEGVDLAALIQGRGRLPVEEAVGYLLQACEALADAHASGVIHRDIKPSNLFLVRKRDGTSVLKVLDFGISKLAQADASDGAATRTAALMGSPLYMSPEQMLSTRDVDARSDVWALGVVLYEALTGQAPFSGDSLPKICAAVMNADPVPPSVRVPGLPRALSAAVLCCLEKSRDKRFASVSELAGALVQFSPSGAAALERIRHSLSDAGPTLDALSPSALGVDSAPTAAASLDAGTNAAWGETRPLANNGRTRAAFVALGALTLLGTGGYWWLSRTPETARLLPATPVSASQPETASPASSAEQAAPIATMTAGPAAPPTAETSVNPTVSSSASASPVSRRPQRERVDRKPAAAPATPSAPRPRPEPESPKPTAPADLGKPGERSRL